MIEGLDKMVAALDEMAVSHSEATYDKVVRKATLDIHKRVVYRTPIDTGNARRGWHAETQFLQGVVYNNVPYIGVLEEGHSKQAPGGMARITVEEVWQEIQEALG